jgi:magnesium transporter
MSHSGIWQDVHTRKPEILTQLAGQHALHPSAVHDCLDPAHYPKVERFGDTIFMIVRYAEHEASADADTLLSLTRKMAFFRKGSLLLTLHRGNAPFLNGEIDSEGTLPVSDPDQQLLKVLKLCIGSFRPLLDSIEHEIDSVERQIFVRKLSRGEILRLHRSRSRLSVVKRLMLHTTMVIQNLAPLLDSAPAHASALQDLKENAEAHFRIADELMEDAQNLLQLQLSLASQRTNEVMRFLTVVSLFFLPLTFIVGVYGMNFKFMPELEEKWGYPAVWGLMIAVSGFIFVRVRRSGWLSTD